MAPRLPLRARGYILASLALGTATLALAQADAPRSASTPEERLVISGGLLVLALGFFLQTRSPSLSWKGHRLALHPDEALLLVAFYHLPPGVVVLAAAGAALATQLSQQKPPTKIAFNVSAHTVATGAGALAHVAALAAGAPPFAAVALVPVVVSAVNQAMVSGLLALLTQARLRSIFAPGLATSVALASVTGVVLGFLTIGLLHVHWSAPLLLLPLGWIAHRTLAAEVRHENEVVARRALHRLHALLADDADVDQLVEVALEVCREAFSAREMEVVAALEGRERRAWRWSNELHAGPAREARALLLDGRQQAIGHIVLLVSWRGRRQLREDQELLDLVAGQLSNALRTLSAMRAAREAEGKLRGVFDALRDPIVVWAPDGRVIHHNAAARDVLDAPGPTGTRRDLERVLEPEGLDRLHAWLATRPTQSAVIDCRTRRGHELEVSLAPIALDGAREGVLAVARDVTEKRRLEREADAHREAAARNDRLAALGVLVAGVAHEINNPLFYMQGHVELAMFDLEDAERAETLLDALAAGERARGRLATVVAGIERIGRISRGLRDVERREPPKAARADLNDVMETAARALRASVPPGAALHVVPAEGPAVVNAAPQDVERVIVNLARNAIDALEPHGGTVEVRCAVRDARAELVVSDTGCGIPEEARARLFVPFHTTKPEGIGLGLPVVHSIVRSLGGEIRYHSAAGVGTTFVVELPLAPEAAAAARPPRGA